MSDAPPASANERADRRGRRRGGPRRPRGQRRFTPEQVAARRASVPRITYPDLPVSARRDDIAAAIRDHQVVVVAGETGSGKTTQLPKILLELGRGVEAQIGHTQPRRIAARAVADRIAEELDVELGAEVGYQVRFADHSGERTLVKVMTDGILLAEIQDDRLLRRYDTIVIDEAHERSLTIDFLLGYLKEILPQRPDLKIVVTSATIDTARFAEHFSSADGVPAPVVEVSGRTYPVEVRYEPYGVDDGDDRDQVQAICDAVVELQREGPGDVLVFLSGEREIRDTAEALKGLNLRETEILPLYSRLSAAEQHRVFEAHPGRRVVLATNVAETSLTVPGIRYVVDSGTARISRYSARLKVQRLPIEPVSQASANQRSGRCGRVADGIAVRLYAEDDYLARPEFTEPEILRTNLASVILQMTALGLGDVERFPFVEPPDSRQVRDGVELLRELGALERSRELVLTETGRRLARLPLDPRLGRMVLEAEKQGCVDELLVIASALSIQDPRERPADKQQQADQAHARFADPNSDFLAFLGLWTYLREQQKALSGNQFRRMCRDEFLHYLRVREWQDVHSQLRQACLDLRISVQRGRFDDASAADPAAVHRSLVAGLLSHVGSYDPQRRDYLGARGARWAVHPSSRLSRKPPQFAVAAELVETSRLFGRVVARVDPLDVERVAGDLVQRTYSEPRWSKKRAAVVADERVTLYGVPLVAGRRVQYARIDPVVSRDLFIRHALVLGEWDSHHRFVRDNARLVDEVAELEDRVRRRDLLVDDQVLVDFFDERVPRDVADGRSFDRWWKTTRKDAPDLLTYPRSLLLRADGGDVDSEFPRRWTFGSFEAELPVQYAFEPGTSYDGVTVDVPVALLPQMHAEDLLWQVPGRREEVVTALLRGLPKALRTSFVPVPDTARAVLPRLHPEEGGLLDALSTELRRSTGVVVPYDAWAPQALPEHLRVTVRVVDDAGAVLAEGKDVDALQEQLAPAVQEAVAEAAQVSQPVEVRGLTDFPAEGVPVVLEETQGEHVVQGFPALVDRGDHVDLRVLVTRDEQEAEMRAGVRRLLRLSIAPPVRYVVGVLTTREKLALGHTPHGGVPELVEDAHLARLDAAVAHAAAQDAATRSGLGFERGLPFSRAAYDLCVEVATDEPGPGLLAVVRQAAAVLGLATEARVRLQSLGSPALTAMRQDVTLQLDELLPDGFIRRTGTSRMLDLQRYLRAVLRRLDTAPTDSARDAARQAEVEAVLADVADVVAALPPARRESEPVQAVRWMVEELRVNLFAQALGTPYPVSPKRIGKALDALLEA
jgi:ATP-dependent helicase HrpA